MTSANRDIGGVICLAVHIESRDARVCVRLSVLLHGDRSIPSSVYIETRFVEIYQAVTEKESVKQI